VLFHIARETTGLASVNSNIHPFASNTGQYCVARLNMRKSSGIYRYRGIVGNQVWEQKRGENRQSVCIGDVMRHMLLDRTSRGLGRRAALGSSSLAFLDLVESLLEILEAALQTGTPSKVKRFNRTPAVMHRGKGIASDRETPDAGRSSIR
jgi:hypothetical protein